MTIRNSINFKLIIIGFLVIISSGVFLSIFLYFHHQHHINNALHYSKVLSDTVKSTARYDMLINNREGLHRMIDTIGHQDGIDVVRIFNKNGMVMFSSKKEEMGKYVDKKTEACYICHAAEKPLERLSKKERGRIFQSKDHHRVLAMITPIYNEPECYNASCHAHSEDRKVLGVLDIGLSLHKTDENYKSNSMVILFFTLFAIISISTIIILYGNRVLLRPVRLIVQATKSVAAGDLDVRIPVKSNDEIGYLALSFNHMIEDLEKANDKIKSWNIELEQKVEERTEKLRLAKEQLLQSEKMASLGVLASSVAHEINNPLQGILTYIRLMLKIIEGSNFREDRVSDFENYLTLMGDEITRCGNIVRNLLVFSKQTKPDIQRANVNNIITNSLLLLDNKISLQSINIHLNLYDDIPEIYCDFRQIQQTVIALIINALEATPKGGKISIGTRKISNVIEITIADTGTGISEENLIKIFDPFFTTKESSKSTGLGLFVAYGIIKDHSGDIEVDSKEGKGTEFRIKIPIDDL